MRRAQADGSARIEAEAMARGRVELPTPRFSDAANHFGWSRLTWRNERSAGHLSRGSRWFSVRLGDTRVTPQLSSSRAIQDRQRLVRSLRNGHAPKSSRAPLPRQAGVLKMNAEQVSGPGEPRWSTRVVPPRYGRLRGCDGRRRPGASGFLSASGNAGAA